MATNPQAAGQTRINFQISEEDRDTLIRLADASGMKLSAYIRLVLDGAVAEELIFKRTTSKKSTPTLDELTVDFPVSKPITGPLPAHEVVAERKA